MTFKSSLNILLLLSLFRSGLGVLPIPCGLGPLGFSYDLNAPNGPTQWTNLDPNFAICANGNMQSPINIPSSVTKDSKSKNPKLKFKTATLKFKCTNFNWELSCTSAGMCGKTKFAGETWRVVNQKFHSPSEHTLKGKRFPLEAQTIHTNSAGSTLIVSTFYKEGKNNNAEFEKLLQNIEGGVEEFQVNLDMLIKGGKGTKKGFCTYQGSLTTPPCTETVTWLINSRRLRVSTSQIQRYESTTGSAPFGNARPIQSINSREVTCFVK